MSKWFGFKNHAQQPHPLKRKPVITAAQQDAPQYVALAGSKTCADGLYLKREGEITNGHPTYCKVLKNHHEDLELTLWMGTGRLKWCVSDPKHSGCTALEHLIAWSTEEIDASTASTVSTASTASTRGDGGESEKETGKEINTATGTQNNINHINHTGDPADLWKAHTLWWQTRETGMVADDQGTKELFTTQSYAADELPHGMYSVRVRMDDDGIIKGERPGQHAFAPHPTPPPLPIISHFLTTFPFI